MQVRSNSLYVFFVGFALFSMFFGAYNLAFPLVMGQKIPLQELPVALLGSFLSFLALPLFGFYAIAVYEGSYKEFFQRLGSLLGFVVIALLMLFFGPLGVMARCVDISYPFAQDLFPTLSLPFFALLFCFFVFLCAMKKSFMMAFLGKVLAPLLFLLLALVALKGFFTPVEPHNLVQASEHPFRFGFFAGYFSLSFVMGILFCYLVVNSMKRISLFDQHVERSLLLKNDVKSMVWASCLLFLVACGLAYTASKFSFVLSHDTMDRIFPTLMHHLFGDQGALLAFSIALLTCVTTAIALAAVFSDFLRHDIFRGRISYPTSLGITLLIGYLVAVKEWTSLFYALAPLLYDLLPGLIVLSLLNVAHRKLHWKISKAASIVLFLATILVARAFV